MDLFKQTEKLKEQILGLKDQLSSLKHTGTSGGGLVAVTVDGNNRICEVKIDNSLFDAQNKEILEDLILTAHNEARSKLEDLMYEKFQELQQRGINSANFPFSFK